ncbi:myb-related transcription factor, partner of profilin-like [Ambystoma mexicanum]|uniref:myb-related transcription factor, partner of profilin-like n=1 Tax=Ambystoma mexicanum TaxID=8296 RepID=UPI0037E91165
MSKGRCPKFTDKELIILVDGVVKEAPRLIGPDFLKTPLRQRNRFWRSILAKINAVATTPRKISQIQKRWQDLKRRIRRLVAAHHMECLATGGGSPLPPLDLRPWEEIAMTVIDLTTKEGAGGVETGLEGEPSESLDEDDGEDGSDEEDPLGGTSESGPGIKEETIDSSPTIPPPGNTIQPLSSTNSTIRLQGHSDTSNISPSDVVTVALSRGDCLHVVDGLEDTIAPIENSPPPAGRNSAMTPGTLGSAPTMAQASTVPLLPPPPFAHAYIGDSVISGIPERLSAMEAAQAQLEENGREMANACSLMVQILAQVNQSLEGLQQEFSVANELREELIEEMRAARQEASAAAAAGAAVAANAAADAAAAAADSYSGAREDARLAREQAASNNLAACHAAHFSAAAVRQLARSNVALSHQMVKASQQYAQSQITMTGLLTSQEQPLSNMHAFDGTEYPMISPSTVPSSTFCGPSSAQWAPDLRPWRRRSHSWLLEPSPTAANRPEIKWPKIEK